MCENIRDTLDLTYYEKLHDDAYDYSQVTVREYLDHLANKWCKLNTIVKKRMKDNFSVTGRKTNTYHGVPRTDRQGARRTRIE